MLQNFRNSLPISLTRRSKSAHVWLQAHVPPPSPDIVPVVPVPPHPMPPSDLPPEITDPVLPGQIQPVREPRVPAPGPMNGKLH